MGKTAEQFGVWGLVMLDAGTDHMSPSDCTSNGSTSCHPVKVDTYRDQLPSDNLSTDTFHVIPADWTITECAEFSKVNNLDFPHSHQGWSKIFKKFGLVKESRFVVKRAVRGGGNAALFEALPHEFQSAVKIYYKRLNDKQRKIALMENQAQKQCVIPAILLNAHQKSVMEARCQIVLRLEQEKKKIHSGFSKVIKAFVKAPIAFDIGSDVIARANDRSNGSSTVSRSSLYNWLNLYKEGGAAALAPHATRQETKVSELDWFDGFMRFYARPQKPTLSHALEMYKDSLDDPASAPSYKQVRTAFNKLDEIEKFVGREGLLTLRNRRAYIDRSTDNLLPTDVYTADGKTFGATVAHPYNGRVFRPEITTVKDVASRKIVGVAISLKENVIAVTEAFRNACVNHGIPGTFYADNGPGYKNKALDADVTGMMARLGTTSLHSAPYNSQARGQIERLNGAVWSQFAREFPTYMGRDMDKETKRAVDKKIKQDLKKFKSSKLLMPWEEFLSKCLERAEKHNNRPHSELPKFTDPVTGKRRHYSPNEFWQMHVENGCTIVPVDDHLKDDLFRPYDIRKVQRGVVRWNNGEYFHSDLEGHNGKYVMVGYDMNDCNRVFIRKITRNNKTKEKQPGQLICIAILAGNRKDYFPETFIQKTRRTRMNTKLRNNEDKKQEIIEEFEGAKFLDHNMQPIVPVVNTPDRPSEYVKLESLNRDHQDDDLSRYRQDSVRPSLTLVNNDKPEQPSSNQPQKFSEIWQLAKHAVDNGIDGLHSNQINLLRSSMKSSVDREMFRMRGVDLQRLNELLKKSA